MAINAQKIKVDYNLKQQNLKQTNLEQTKIIVNPNPTMLNKFSTPLALHSARTGTTSAVDEASRYKLIKHAKLKLLTLLVAVVLFFSLFHILAFNTYNANNITPTTNTNLTASAASTMVSGVTYTYTLSSSKATIYNVSPATITSLTIPATLNGYPVVEIEGTSGDSKHNHSKQCNQYRKKI